MVLNKDFNTTIHKEDRIARDAITVNDLREMQNLMDKCELAEMRSSGAYYSWLNRTIWSRIDRTLHNQY